MQVLIIKKIMKMKNKKKKKRMKVHKKYKINKNNQKLLMKNNGKLNGNKKIQKLKFQKNQKLKWMMILQSNFLKNYKIMIIKANNLFKEIFFIKIMIGQNLFHFWIMNM